MSFGDESATPFVLHLCPESPPLPWVERLQNRLTHQTLPVRQVGDVYRALARIARTAPNEIAAVLVCVDGIGPDEWEFFTLVSRLRSAPRIYVYGDDRSRPGIERALQLGAFAILSDVTFAEVSSTLRPAADQNPPAQPEVQPQLRPPPSPSAEQSEPAPAPAPAPTANDLSFVEEQATDSDDDLEETSTEADLEEPVRVPWIRYDDRPARVRPEPPETPAAQPRSADPRPLRPVPREPLLTDEELRALLGDDIASIAPRRYQSRPAPDAPHEGKT